MEPTNLMLRLPRELRDEVYAHIFSLSSRPCAVQVPTWSPSTASIPITITAIRVETLPKARYRLATTTEAKEIREAGQSGCQRWPSCDETRPVISRMLETAILRTSKQIYEEAHEYLVKLITKSPILFAPPAGTRITPYPSPQIPARKVSFSISKQTKANNAYELILKNATILEMIPFSWPQLQQCINILVSDTSLEHVTINFKRMVRSLEPYQWPRSNDIKHMLSRLSTIRAKTSAKIVWYATLDSERASISGLDAMAEMDKTFCSRAVRIAEELMVMKGTQEEEKWLWDDEVDRDEPTSWQVYCKRVDVDPAPFLSRRRKEDELVRKY